MIVDGIIRLHLQAAHGTYQTSVLGQGEDGKERLATRRSTDSGSDREDLKRSAKVEHFHVVKEQDANIHVPFSFILSILYIRSQAYTRFMVRLEIQEQKRCKISLNA